MSWRPKRWEEYVYTTQTTQYDIRATLDHRQVLTITVTESPSQTEYQQEFCQMHFNQRKIEHIAETLLEAIKPLNIRQRCKIFTHADWCYLTVDNGSDFPSFALPKVDIYAAQKKSIRIYRSSPCLHSAYSDINDILEDEEDQKMAVLTPTADGSNKQQYPSISSSTSAPPAKGGNHVHMKRAQDQKMAVLTPTADGSNKQQYPSISSSTSAPQAKGGNHVHMKRARTLSKPPPVTSDMLVNYGVLSTDFNVNRHDIQSHTNTDTTTSEIQTIRSSARTAALQRAMCSAPPPRALPRPPRRAQKRYVAPPPRIRRHPSAPSVAPPPRPCNENVNGSKNGNDEQQEEYNENDSKPVLPKHTNTSSMNNAYRHYEPIASLKNKRSQQNPGNGGQITAKPPLKRHAKSAKNVHRAQRAKPVPVGKAMEVMANKAEKVEIEEEIYTKLEQVYMEYVAEKDERPEQQNAGNGGQITAKPPLKRHAKSAKNVHRAQRAKAEPVGKAMEVMANKAEKVEIEEEIYTKLEQVYMEYVAEKDERPGNTFDLINFIQFKGVKGINFKHVGKFLMQYQAKEVNAQN
eukprot:CAMPEP_0197073540 /NCGR_PEP_ID=MMETSP1384-20130603/210656_1 /TAXON_ID=29189 /ORGANISM="Ammonia sp." /LENGTH=574 /DNA_ID=CAMNT_0042512377 /DNA_START=27 /DNA_END=1752 /DNA_ORIENTATION=-